MELFYYPAPCRERGCAASVVAVADVQVSAGQHYCRCRCRHRCRQLRRCHQHHGHRCCRSRPLRHCSCCPRNRRPLRHHNRCHRCRPKPPPPLSSAAIASTPPPPPRPPPLQCMPAASYSFAASPSWPASLSLVPPLPATAVPCGLSPRRRRLRRRHRHGGEGAPLAVTASSSRPPPSCTLMTRCRRLGPAPWRQRWRQWQCHHRCKRQGCNDSEDHAPAVAIDFTVVIVIVRCVFNFFVFIECRVT